MHYRIVLFILAFIGCGTISIGADWEQVPLTPAERAQLKYFFRDFLHTLFVEGKACRVLESPWIRAPENQAERNLDLLHLAKYRKNIKLRSRILNCLGFRLYYLHLMCLYGTWPEYPGDAVLVTLDQVMNSPGFRMGYTYRLFRERELEESEDEQVLIRALRALEPILDEVERRLRRFFPQEGLIKNLSECIEKSEYSCTLMEGRKYYRIQLFPGDKCHLICCKRKNTLKIVGVICE
ncbi:MAG: hypothetical protein KA419_11055 [Acidobacteria bacterium]|nr:hypothetical protein [Acidobacteriota bacterium]